MYQIGDLVVHGSMGVCRVEGFSQPNSRDQKQFYCLSPLYQPGVVYTPVESSKVPLRPVMTAEDASALLEKIPQIGTEVIKERTLQLLSQRYQSVLQSGDSLQLLTLILSVREKRRQAELQNRRLGMVDERFCRQAERLLFGELAVALSMPVEEVSACITARLPEPV